MPGAAAACYHWIAAVVDLYTKQRYSDNLTKTDAAKEDSPEESSLSRVELAVIE